GREPAYDLVGVLERGEHAGMLTAEVAGQRRVGAQLAEHGPEDGLLVLVVVVKLVGVVLPRCDQLVRPLLGSVRERGECGVERLEVAPGRRVDDGVNGQVLGHEPPFVRGHSAPTSVPLTRTPASTAVAGHRKDERWNRDRAPMPGKAGSLFKPPARGGPTAVG